MTGTLHEDRCVFVVVSRRVLLRMRNVSDKVRRDNQNKHFIFNIFFLNRFDYEIACKNVVEP